MNRSSRKIDSRRIFSREYDFPKTFPLTENQFSRKTYFYTIASRDRFGYTAVFRAVHGKNVECVEWLLENGASLCVVSNDRQAQRA